MLSSIPAAWLWQLDDLLARQQATILGVPVLGTLAILGQSKKQGFISEMRPLVLELLDLGFRLSHKLASAILKSYGEDPLPPSH